MKNEPLKSAEEWHQLAENMGGFDSIDAAEDHIKAIQLNAIKHGMTLMSDKVFAFGQQFSGQQQEAYHVLAQDMLTARDNFTL